MSTLAARTQDLVEEFSFFDDWSDKYAHIIDMGKTLQPMQEEDKVPDNLIKGCQSNVWLSASLNEGKVEYHADSDAIIVKGIVGMLVRLYNGCEPQEIVNSDNSFMEQIGLQQHLSPTRANGLASMMKQMKWYALALQAQTN